MPRLPQPQPWTRARWPPLRGEVDADAALAAAAAFVDVGLGCPPAPVTPPSWSLAPPCDGHALLPFSIEEAWLSFNAEDACSFVFESGGAAKDPAATLSITGVTTKRVLWADNNENNNDNNNSTSNSL